MHSHKYSKQKPHFPFIFISSISFLFQNKEKVPSPVPIKRTVKQTQPSLETHNNRRNYSHHEFYKIFEPRPELSYNDVNIDNVNCNWKDNDKSSRPIPRYIGANTCGDLPQDNNKPRKLVRRETVIASWKYLKDEREKALGLGAPKRRVKVSRTQSERLANPPLRRYSSKRKSVIYSYDPDKKALKEEFIQLSDDSDTSSISSEIILKDPKILKLKDNSSIQKSSSFTKFKSLLARMFTGSKSIV